MPTDKKSLIVYHLNILLNVERENKQVHKMRAYTKIIKALAECDAPINTEDDIDKIPGIGKGSIRERIIQIIENGHTDETRELMKDDNKRRAKFEAEDRFAEIMGIGHVKAKNLVVEHKLITIDDLRANQHLLNRNQIAGLQYHEDFMQRIPYDEMTSHRNVLTDAIASLGAVGSKLTFDIVGSYRRHAETSGDIDVLITTSNAKTSGEAAFQALIQELKDRKYILHDFAAGAKKYMGACKLPHLQTAVRRIDLMFTEPARYPFALLYFTGSKQFNVAMRARALNLGYSMNEYGLKMTGDSKENMISKKFSTEKSVFKFLGIEWVAPEDRTSSAVVVKK